MKTPDKLLAEKMLHIGAIQLQPESPFLLASGWNSPIYTDMRRLLSYPDVRNFLKIELARTIMEIYPDADALVSSARGGIAIGAIVADTLGLPYAIVRDTPKDHGLENLIEGNLKPGWKVVVVDYLVSTGGSSVLTVENVRNAGCDVSGIVSVFDYEFPIARQRFRKENIDVHPLLTFNVLLEVAREIHYIEPDDMATLSEWREDPAAWSPQSKSPF